MVHLGWRKRTRAERNVAAWGSSDRWSHGAVRLTGAVSGRPGCGVPARRTRDRMRVGVLLGRSSVSCSMVYRPAEPETPEHAGPPAPHPGNPEETREKRDS